MKRVIPDRRCEQLCHMPLNFESNEQRKVVIGSGTMKIVADFGRAVVVGGEDKT